MRDALGSVQSMLVLGGGSEIALAITRALVAERTRTVILAGRSPERLEEPAAELRAAGAQTVETARFEADEPEQHEAFADEVFARSGDIDLVLVAFGALGEASRSAREPAAAAAVARTNFVGAVSASIAAAERLRRQGHGMLVVLSSVAGERVRAANFVYGASKAGLDGFAQGLGDSLAGSGVRVMVVRPGFVRTKMTAHLDAAPFATDPDSVAEEVMRGLRRGSETVWAPPVLRFVMALLRHLPRPLFRRIGG